MNGRGVYVWAPNGKWAGYRYEGDWKDGKRQGRGVYVTANGDRYEGDFKDGKKHGRGVLVWGSKSKWAGDRYEGDFKDDKKHGRGVYVTANGDRYEGGWKDGKRHEDGKANGSGQTGDGGM